MTTQWPSGLKAPHVTLPLCLSGGPSGAPVVGYRAPTFSLVRETAWAIDVLAESGMEYDSSIYPVRHDRYGMPAAPRNPFIARTSSHGILELQTRAV